MNKSNDKALEFYICDCSQLWRKVYGTHTEHLALIGIERRVILQLHDRPGISQVVLADLLELDPQGLTRILDRMIKKGSVEKRPSPTDRRANELYLTQAGKTTYQKIMQVANKLRPNVLNGIEKSDLERLERALKQLKSNLQALL